MEGRSMECQNCGKPTTNPKFCSVSCSATYTNKAHPKRKPTGTCSVCAKPIPSNRKRCPSCREAQKSAIKDTTIGEFREKERSKGRHPSWIHHEVRVLNRIWNKGLLSNPCRKCGYSLHVELAHLRPISTFPDSSTLREVNDPSNLVPLCPNCHWELDKGLFKVEDLPSL